MSDENLIKQLEEIEALASIYGDDWSVVDSRNRVYSVDVVVNEISTTLKVSFPENYPLHSPPVYQINAPWLRGEERQKLYGELEDCYIDNCGESVVYQWVEIIRAFLTNVSDNHASSLSSTSDNTTQNDALFHPQSDLDIAAIDAHPDIKHSEPITRRASTFQAHLASVHDKSQVKTVLDGLLENKKIGNATHNIMAYRIVSDDSSVEIQDCDDDGETHAGARLLSLLRIVDARDVVLVVSRWFGGTLLGPERFRLINNCARDLLQENGYIKDKDERKGPKSKMKQTK